MRIVSVAAKELRCVRGDLPFHLAALISPLLFLLAFSLMLSSGILLPVQTYPGTGDSAFLRHLEEFRAPDGTAYLALSPAAEDAPPTGAESDLIVVRREPAAQGGVIGGEIVHYLNDVNENMTKNFRNRLSGALVSYVETLRAGGNVTVNEITMYGRDIPWATGFGVSVLVFGAMLSGLVFGMLSAAGEWGAGTAVLLKLAPAAPGTVLAGKLLAGLIKCCLAGAAFLGIFYLLSAALPVRALPFAAAALLTHGVFLCLGMCLGLWVRSSLTAFLLSLVSALVLWVGGGGFGPLSYHGGLANAVGRFDPATYAIELVRWCYFGGTARPAAGFAALALAFLLAAGLALAVYTGWARREGGV